LTFSSLIEIVVFLEVGVNDVRRVPAIFLVVVLFVEVDPIAHFRVVVVPVGVIEGSALVAIRGRSKR
jgi:hypothetical protein